MNCKRLVLATIEFPPQPGGIGHHAFNLARELSVHGWEVRVFTNSRSREEQAIEQTFDREQPFSVIRIPRCRLVILTYLWRLLAFGRLMVTCKPATIMASGQFALWMLAAVKWIFPDSRYVAVLHGSEVLPGNAVLRWLTRQSLRRFDQIIAVSHFTRTLVQKLDNRLSATVINNGFDPQKFERATSIGTSLPGKPGVITVGSVTHRKGQHNVIRALPVLLQKWPELQYHIVGLPVEKAYCEKLAWKLGVEDHVTFHDSVADAALAGLVKAANVFIMLSDHLPNGDVEGFGIAVLEANYCGLPAIGSRNSGIADAIRDGYSGRLVDPHDPEEIARALEDILANKETYSRQARTWSEQFTWERKISEYLQILEP